MKIKRLLQSPRVQNIEKFCIFSYDSDISVNVSIMPFYQVNCYLDLEVLAFGIRDNCLRVLV